MARRNRLLLDGDLPKRALGHRILDEVAEVLVLIAVAVPGISLISISVALLTAVVNLLSNLAELWALITRSITRVPSGTLIGISVVLGSWFVFASIAWGVSIYKLLTRREQVA